MAFELGNQFNLITETLASKQARNKGKKIIVIL